MPDETGQERTEQATQKRREETRKRGQVARSTEVNSAVILLTGFSVLMLFRHRILMGIENYISGIFSQIYTYDLSLSNTNGIMIHAIYSFFSIMLPVFIFMAVAGILVNIFQVGFLK